EDPSRRTATGWSRFVRGERSGACAQLVSQDSRPVTADHSRSTVPQRIPSQVVASRLHPIAIRLSEGRFALLLVLPALLGILVVVLFPLLYSLWLSFTDVNLLRQSGPAIELFGVRVPLFRFVGLQNYARIFADPLYWSSLWRTLYFVGAFVLEATLVGIGMERAQRARVRLHVEPGALRRAPVPGRHAVHPGGSLQRGRGRRGGLLAALPPRDPSRPPADPVPAAGARHRERVPDARPHLRP